MKILIIDNYDSFTYNLVNIIRKIKKHDYRVVKAGEINLQEIISYDKIIFSPGPDVPSGKGIMQEVILNYGDKKSIFGVCLGFQAIALYFGAELKNLDTVVHGRKKQINILDKDEQLFSGLPAVFEAGLYHSWTVSHFNFPESLKITAISEDNIIMAVSHKIFDIKGVQFHPESIMTSYGENIIRNWIGG